MRFRLNREVNFHGDFLKTKRNTKARIRRINRKMIRK